MRTSFLPQLRSPRNTAATADTDWITKARLAAPRKHHVVEAVSRQHQMLPADFQHLNDGANSLSATPRAVRQHHLTPADQLGAMSSAAEKEEGYSVDQGDPLGLGETKRKYAQMGGDSRSPMAPRLHETPPSVSLMKSWSTSGTALQAGMQAFHGALGSLVSDH